MDIIQDVYSRLQRLAFPIVHDKLNAMVTDMLTFQMTNANTLTPLKRMMLEDRIVQRYMDAMAREHDPVGVNAALTIGENLVQSSLGAKHTAGLKRGATGFDRAEEVTNMKNRSDIVKLITTPINGVPRSREEINQLANEIIRVQMEDLKEKYEVLRLAPAPEGESSVATISPYPPWYTVQLATRAIGRELLSPVWLRIYLDKEKLYRHRISIPNIVSNIQDNMGARGIVLYPPAALGTFIDIHTISDRTEEQYMSRLGMIMSLQVGGITTVQNAHAIFENLLTNLRLRELGDNEYEVVTSAPLYVPSYAWENMLRAMVPGIEFVGTSGRRFISNHGLRNLRRMILENPLMYADVVEQGGVTTDANGIIHVRFREYETYRDADGVERRDLLTNRYPYLQYANLEPISFRTQEEADRFLLDTMVGFHLFWYIEATCSHVQHLFVLREVDPSRTFTTSPMDCMASLGYLAMRNMIFQELVDNINVEPTHIRTIVNNMTLYKEPVSIKRQSLKNDKSEWMTYTTFEDVLKYITQAAFAGETDHMQSVSSRILTGRHIPIGRGGQNMPEISPANTTGNRFVEMKIQQRNEEQRRAQRAARGRGGASTRGARRGRGASSANNGP